MALAAVACNPHGYWPTTFRQTLLAAIALALQAQNRHYGIDAAPDAPTPPPTPPVNPSNLPR